MTDIAIRKTIFLKADPDTVWAFLTEAEKLARWFNPADGDLAEGEEFRLLGDDGSPVCWGAVRAAERPGRLAYSFTAKPLDGHMTEVEWLLEPVPGGTRLSLTHTGLPAGAEAFGLVLAFDKGWDEHLAQLRPATAA